MFGNSINDNQRKHYTKQFISTVNAVLQQYRGKLVEQLAIRFEFDNMLVDHLNNWVRFAASSHTKFIAFDLIPRGLEALDDPQYIFPFQIFDRTGLSRLHHVQLRFVSFELPTQFCGFPKLRKLDLHEVKLTAKHLQGILSNCCALEWLSLVFCKMDGELKVHSPLPCLLYLNVVCCELTKVELIALKLRTFVYEGTAVPINLGEGSEMKNANVTILGATFEDAIPALAGVLTDVQNLTFKMFVYTQEVRRLMETPFKFSHFKHLQLLLNYNTDIDNLSLVPLLGSAPFIEKLEIHFSSLFGFYFMNGTSIRRFRHTYSYLKDLCITGFKASSGQTEFLVHIVENTPALEALTIDPSDRLSKAGPLIIIEREANFMEGSYRLFEHILKRTFHRNVL